MKLLINGRWRLSLSELEKRVDKKDDNSFLYWINHSLPAIRQHASGQLKVMEKTKAICPDIKTVNEHFGGSGIGTMIIQNVFKPARHNVWDIDPICVDNIYQNHPNGKVNIRIGDARETMIETEPADFTVLDFNRFTATHIDSWKQQFDVVFGRHPKAVHITDTALSKVPLLKRYFSQALGKDITDKESYLKGYSSYFFHAYGYAMRFAAYSNFACMVFIPSDQERNPELYKLNKEDGLVALQAW